MYVACEQVFRPDLRKSPCIVLSNNDGCVVAANRLAKEAGIKKFEPYFRQKKIIEQHRIQVFSSNYELYADISEKMMNVIARYSQRSHVYSIDEIFLDLHNYSEVIPNLLKYGLIIRKAVWKECRLPVCFGAGDTLTLSKLANRTAKVHKELNGVCVIDTESKRIEYLRQQPVSEVWGIGRQLTKKMNWMGIHTAYDLACLSPKKARCCFNIEVERTVRELNGQSCKKWDECKTDKQQIFSTRSVGTRITTIDQLKQALAFHAGIVSRKARSQNSSCTFLTAFASNSPFDNLPQSYKGIHRFDHPTNCSSQITSAVTSIANLLFRPEVEYYRVGVGLIELVNEKCSQKDFFAIPDNPVLMQTLDKLNGRYGNGTVFLATQGTSQEWQMKREFLSPMYTTKFKDLPKIQC